MAPEPNFIGQTWIRAQLLRKTGIQPESQPAALPVVVIENVDAN
jgi:hypothetical protein